MQASRLPETGRIWRAAEEKLPEYRVDIENRVKKAVLDEGDKEVCFPVIMKEVSREDEEIWTDALERNAYLEETFKLQDGESDYRSFEEIKADTESNKILITSTKPVSRELHNKQSTDSIMREFTDNYLNPFIEQKMAELELEEEGTRNPDVKEYLLSYKKEDLEEKAKEFNITCSGSTKEELAEEIAKYVLSPEGMREIFLQADEWEADAFEAVLDKKCFLAEETDWIKLGWLSDAGYVVSYSDHHAEVPKAVISLYKEINTPEFRKLCRQVSWMRSCQTMLGFIYAIAPLKIVYRMYRRRPDYKVSYDEFLEILKQVPENDNMCIVRDDKMILKTVLRENLYERIEEYQGDREFYMPSPEEVLDYAKHGYPSQDPAYKKLENFLREELHQNTAQITELMYIVFKEFSMDGMLSDITEEIDRENKIITDLLSLVKMDKKAADMNISNMNINELLENILKRLRPIADQRRIDLILDSFRPVTADVDEVKFTLAISNLVENGIKYNVDEGWVRVTLDADHKDFYVTVADSGLGIPEDSIERIFERFYRVDKSHSREIGGTGLGLAITRSSIAMHHGIIKVSSKEGEGTTFTVKIPLSYIPS